MPAMMLSEIGKTLLSKDPDVCLYADIPYSIAQIEDFCWPEHLSTDQLHGIVM